MKKEYVFKYFLNAALDFPFHSYGLSGYMVNYMSLFTRKD